MKFLIFLFVALAAANAHEEKNYEGYTVFRMTANSENQRQLLSSFEKNDAFDFWSDINNNGAPIDVMVAPKDQYLFLSYARTSGMQPQVMIENVQRLIENERVSSQPRAMTWTSYHTLDSIYSWLDEIAAGDSRASVIIGGSTYQNRQIKGVKISFGSGKKSVFVEGGIHAREWISPATITYLINELLTSTDATFRKVANSFDWYIFPSTNPDGYVHSHTTDRMWRKTRRPYGTCVGADPNRNWNAHWAEQGASTNPCSDLYAGPSAFSEIETKSLSDYIRSISSNMVAYLDFHSYSQYYLLPYGHTTAPLDNYVQMMQIGRASTDALARRYGTRYKVGNIAETIYLASGGSIDWVKQEFQTPIVVAYELRDTGRYGFILPADQIIPNSLEVMDSIVAMFEEAERIGYVTLG